jgi:hypothetical protein
MRHWTGLIAVLADLPLFVLLVGTATFIGACATTTQTLPTSVPLPADLLVVPPAPGIDPTLASFSGLWAGAWDNILDHVLVVEKVYPWHANVIYAHGSAPLWNIFEGRWYRALGKFENGVLTLVIPNRPVTITYRLAPDGTLRGSYKGRTGEWGTVSSTVVLTRVK